MRVRVGMLVFDGTLYKKDTYKVMMDYLKHHPIYGNRYRGFILRMLPSYIGAKLKVYPRQRMETRAMQVYLNTFKDLPSEDLHTYFEEISEEFMKDFNEKVVQRLKDHEEKGVYTMLVSGAYLPLLLHATKGFPFDKIIGSEIPFEQGQSAKDFKHIRGKRKTEAIHKVLAQKDIDWENSYAYADSR